MLLREISAVAIYLLGTQNTQIISGLMDRSVINITQLASINVPRISCTFACHKSRHVCALRTAYSLVQWLNFYIFSLQYAKCPQPAYHSCFPDDGVTSSYVLPASKRQSSSPSTRMKTSNHR